MYPLLFPLTKTFLLKWWPHKTSTYLTEVAKKPAIINQNNVPGPPIATMPATPKILPKSVEPAIAVKTILLLETVPSCLFIVFFPFIKEMIDNGSFLKFVKQVIKAKYIDANKSQKIKNGKLALSVQNKTSKNNKLFPISAIFWKKISEVIVITDKKNTKLYYNDKNYLEYNSITKLNSALNGYGTSPTDG